MFPETSESRTSQRLFRRHINNFTAEIKRGPKAPAIYKDSDLSASAGFDLSFLPLPSQAIALTANNPTSSPKRILFIRTSVALDESISPNYRHNV